MQITQKIGHAKEACKYNKLAHNHKHITFVITKTFKACNQISLMLIIFLHPCYSSSVFLFKPFTGKTNAKNYASKTVKSIWGFDWR